MKGFDPKWKDFPDYILGITAEIWEGRGIATLHERVVQCTNYTDQCTKRQSYHLV